MRLPPFWPRPVNIASAYLGSGPAQLALALLADALRDDEEAEQWQHDFTSAVIAGLPQAGWALTEDDIRDTITAFENE